MNDIFRSEYKKSIDGIQLPADFKEKILSNLKEQVPAASLPEIAKPAEGKKNIWKTLCSMAAVLVVIASITLFFAFYQKVPSTKEITLNISSATNLASIHGARVVFKDSKGKLLEDDNGEVLTAYTDEQGVATATVPDTHGITAEISMEGYIPLEESADKGNYYISPKMSEDTYRAVLTWEGECDLDALLSVSDDEKTDKINYFSSDIKDEKGEVIATLDTDSEVPNSPETITFNCTEDKVFRLSVASYSSLKNSDPDDLKNSGAKVTLYKGDKLIGTYHTDSAKEGNAWCVFEIENHQLTACDYTYTVSAITDVK